MSKTHLLCLRHFARLLEALHLFVVKLKSKTLSQGLRLLLRVLDILLPLLSDLF